MSCIKARSILRSVNSCKQGLEQSDHAYLGGTEPCGAAFSAGSSHSREVSLLLKLHADLCQILTHSEGKHNRAGDITVDISCCGLLTFNKIM